jgi:multidrug transporter EmrE-like cation transporter
MYWILLSVSLVLNATGNILAKYAMKDAPSNQGLYALALYALTNWKVWLGIICFGLAFGGYAIVLSKLDISLAYPIMTTGGFLIIITASFFLFSENLSLTKLIGISLMIAGIWIISRG